MLKTNRVRADTTVVEANVAYPVDSSLLAKGVARLAKLARRAHAQGLAVRTPLRDRTRSVYRRARDVVNTLRQRGDEARVRVHRLNAELAQIAQQAIGDAEAVIRNARRRVGQLGERATGRQRAVIDDLVTLSERLATVAAQTRQRVVDGVTPPGRRGSCHCTTQMRVRSRRVVSGARSSSVTRPRSSTTKTGSSSITTSRSGTRSTRRCSFPQSNASPVAPAAHPRQSPPIAATGKPPSKTRYAPAVCATSCCPAKGDRTRRAARSRTVERSRRWSDGEPAAKAASAAPTRLRTRPHPPRRHRRRANVVRARHLRPQPRQDRRTHPMTAEPPMPTKTTPQDTPNLDHSPEFFRSK